MGNPGERGGAAAANAPLNDAANVLHRIALRLRPRFDEIERLHKQLIPAGLRQMRQGHRWALTLDPANMRVMATVDGRWDEEVRGSKLQESAAVASSPEGQHGLQGSQGHLRGSTQVAAAPVEVPDKMAGIVEGALEQARFILSIINSQAASPVLASSRSLGLDPGAILSCGKGAGPDVRTSLLSGIVCPLKFGSLGVDVL